MTYAEKLRAEEWRARLDRPGGRAAPLGPRRPRLDDVPRPSGSASSKRSWGSSRIATATRPVAGELVDGRGGVVATGAGTLQLVSRAARGPRADAVERLRQRRPPGNGERLG